MNKPGTIKQFEVFDKVEYLAKQSVGVKLIQTLTLQFIGGRKWLNTKNQQEITLKTTNIRRHYQAVGKDGLTYFLVLK